MRLLKGDGRMHRFARFVLVGGLSTLLYGVISTLLIRGQLTSPVGGAFFGYLASVPFNYVLQRGFAFNSKNPARSEFARYLAVHGANLALSTFGMHVITRWLHADYRIGILATMLFVPVIVFLVLDRWVFVSRTTSPSPPR